MWSSFASFDSHKRIPLKLLSKPLAEWIGLSHLSLFLSHTCCAGNCPECNRHTLCQCSSSPSRRGKQQLKNNKYPESLRGVDGSSWLMLSRRPIPRPCHLLVGMHKYQNRISPHFEKSIHIYIFGPLSHLIGTQPLWKLLLAAVSRVAFWRWDTMTPLWQRPAQILSNGTDELRAAAQHSKQTQWRWLTIKKKYMMERKFFLAFQEMLEFILKLNGLPLVTGLNVIIVLRTQAEEEPRSRDWNMTMSNNQNIVFLPDNQP